MVSDLDWSYLAGLIDGEGSIRIEKSGGHKYPGTPTVCVTNSNPTLIMWVYSKFGGHLYKKKSKGKYQVVWDIYWLGKRAEEVLQGVYPYLTAKKEQTKLVFDYRKLIGKPGKRLTASNIEKRQAIVEAMSILKRNSQILKEEE